MTWDHPFNGKPPLPRLNAISVRILRQVANHDLLPIIMDLREQAELAALVAMRLVSRSGGVHHLTELGRAQLERERELS